MCVTYKKLSYGVRSCDIVQGSNNLQIIRLQKSFPKDNNDSHIKETFMSLHILEWSYRYCRSVVKLQMV